MVQVFFGRLPLHIEIVTELALLPLLARAFLVKLTQHRLRVDTKGHLLRLHRFEELGRLFPRLFSSLLLLLLCCLLGVFLFLLCRLAGGGLRFELFDLLLGGAALFVFHAEGLVRR